MATKLTKHRAEQCKSNIEAGKIVRRLQDHLHGKTEMTATQVRAATALLNKIVPDEQSLNLRNETETPSMTMEEINIALVDTIDSLPEELAVKAFRKLCQMLPHRITGEIYRETITYESAGTGLKAVP